MMMGVKLSSVDHHTYLGVEFNKDLSWNLHIKKICGKADRTLNFLRRNLYGCPKNIKDTAYKVYVRPNLVYSGTAWDPYQQKYIKIKHLE